MTQNNLKSTIDLSFANVNLSQSQLLQLDAQNNADATHGDARYSSGSRS